MPFSRQHHVVHLVVGELRVAAVDDDVARAEQLAELLDRGPGRLARRAPSPRPPAGRRSASTRASRLSTSRLPGLWSKPDDLVAGAAEPLGHVAAHLAQPDQPHLHDVSSLSASRDSVLIVGVPPRPAPATPAGSAGQAHRHDQVAVAARPLGRLALAVVGGGLVDPGQDGGLERAGEGHPRPVGVHRGQAVEQVRRVEGDRQRLAVELDAQRSSARPSSSVRRRAASPDPG